MQTEKGIGLAMSEGAATLRGQGHQIVKQVL